MRLHERKKNGWSQEEFASMLSVSRQAVSKWESAQSTPDLQRVIQMAQIFGVSTDYLLRDDLESDADEKDGDWSENEREVRSVSMEEANAFLDFRRNLAEKIAAGVSMCILSPVFLILLGGLTDEGYLPMPENIAVALGIIVLFVLIAGAVFLFITESMKGRHFDYLESDVIETAYGVSGMVREKENAFEATYTRGIAIGVVMCIVAVVPLVAAGALDLPDNILIGCTALLLVLIAVAVNLIVRAAMIKGGFETLLQVGEYTRELKTFRRKMDPFATLYWCLATAIYLGWSFWTGAWHFTWIIWPVAGVAYGVLVAIVKIVYGNRD